MNRHSHLVPILFALLALSGAWLGGCNDSVIRGEGCVDDSDCLSGRMCSDGYCMDNPDAGEDVGFDADDVGFDVVETDSGRDVQIPDVPPPRTCLTATDASIDLGRIDVGARRARTVEIANCGRFPVEVTGATLEGTLGGSGTGLLDTGNLPLTLDAGETGRIILRIAADQAGRFDGTVVVFSDAPDLVEIDVTLVVGEGEFEDCVEVTPLTNFGTGIIPSTTRIPVEVRNCGDTQIELSDVSITGPGSPFFELEEPERLLDPGQATGVPVVFVAQELGTWEASLAVRTAGGAESAGVLFGIAAEEHEEFVCLRVNPLVVRRSGVTSEGFRDQVVATVENCGEVPLEFGSPTLEGDLSIVRRFDGGPFVTLPVEILEPGERAPVGFEAETFDEGVARVRYRQDVVNVAAAPLVFDFELTVVNDEPGEACLTASPTAIDLGLVSPETVREFTIQATNCGDIPLTVRTIEASPEFILSPLDIAGSVAPGETLSWPAEFDANMTDREGTVNGTLVLGEPGVASVTIRISATIVRDVPPECVTAEPGDLDLGTLGAGDETVANVDAFNCGEIGVELISARILAGASRNVRDIFVEPVALAPGERIPAIGVGVVGEVAGPFTASYVLTSSTGATFGPFTINGVVDSVAEECIRTEPTRVDFGAIEVGEFYEQFVGVQNCGEEPVIIESIGFARSLPFSLVFDRMLPFEIEPLQEVSFQVEADPTVEGAFNRTVTIRSTRGTVLEVPVTATAVDASDVCAVFEPFEVDFGVVTVGDSALETVLLTNCGSRRWRLASIESPEREVEATPLSGSAAPGESIEIELRYAPTSASSVRADITVFLEAVDGSTARTAVFVEGIGRTSTSGPLMRVEPSSLEFGDVRSGGVARRTFEVCNDGDDTLRLIEFSLSGADEDSFSVSISDDRVEPGECLALDVTFRPSGVAPGSEEPFFADLLVVSNSVEAPEQRVRLSGIGFAESEGTTCFAPVEPFLPVVLSPGESTRTNVDFVNCGSLPLFVGEFSASVPGLRVRDVTLEADDELLEPGERITISLTIDALSSGTFVGSVLATALETDSPRLLEAETSLQIEVVSGAPCLIFEPNVVEFGDIPAGEFVGGVINLRNCGDVSLTLVDVNLLVDVGEFVFLDTETIVGRTLAPGRSINVAFEIVGESAGEIFYVFEAQTAEGASATVEIAAFVDAPSDDCVDIIPGSLEFGAVELGRSHTISARIRNCGDTTQRITDIGFSRGSSPLFGISSTDRPLPTTLLPGQSMRVQVFFEAGEPGFFEGEFFVNTLDGRVAEAPVSARVFEEECEDRVPLVATSPDGPFGPEASVVVDTPIYLVIDGSADVDAEWFVIEGDPREVEFGSAPGLTLAQFGRAGEYVLGVEWRDAFGCSGSGEVFVDVRRDTTVGEGIRVVITWRTPGDPDEFSGEGSDVDLHLVRNSGRRLDWNGDNDCYYGNRDTFWGCQLLRDELNGLGPEIVVVPDPTEEYYVGVYYFSVPGFSPEFSTVTLRIFLDGEQVVTATRNLERSGRFWPAARIIGREVELLDLDNQNGFPDTLP